MFFGNVLEAVHHLLKLFRNNSVVVFYRCVFVLFRLFDFGFLERYPFIRDLTEQVRDAVESSTLFVV